MTVQVSYKQSLFIYLCICSTIVTSVVYLMKDCILLELEIPVQTANHLI